MELLEEQDISRRDKMAAQTELTMLIMFHTKKIRSNFSPS